MCILCGNSVVTFAQLQIPWAPRYIAMSTISGWISYDEYVVCGSCQVSVWRDSAKSVDLDDLDDDNRSGVECRKQLEILAEEVGERLYRKGCECCVEKIECSRTRFFVEEKEDTMSIDV